VSTDQLCRVTIVGPERQVDLAVPLVLPLGGLLPALVQHVVPGGNLDQGESGGWILQRLGEDPMAVGETPEELSWHEGERFYLRRSDEILPPVVYDDIADGAATTVSAVRGRWQPEHNARLFVAVAVAVIALLVKVLLNARMEGSTPFVAAVIAVALLAAALGLRRRSDPAVAVTATLASALTAAIAAGSAVGGLDHGIADLLAFETAAVVSAAWAVAVVGGIVAVTHLMTDTRTSLFPALALTLTGLVTVVAVTLERIWTITAVQMAGLVSLLIVLTLAYAPRFAVRAAGLRVPQLPRKASELQFDIVPMGSAEMSRRTFVADQLLTAFFVTAAAVTAGAVPVLIGSDDVFAYLLGVMVVVSVLVRAGAARNVRQRLALVAGGLCGAAALVLWLLDRLSEGWSAVLAAALTLLLVPIGAAALRSPGRRMLPIWGYLNEWVELLTAVATIPLIAQLFGLFGWAGGLFG